MSLRRNRPLRLLLVDDDDVFALLLKESIAEHEQFSSEVAIDRVSDGDQALALLAERGSGESGGMPDLVLLDQRMPKMDGTEVLARMRSDESTRCLPVCMFSTSDIGSHVKASYAAGANFCLTKPSRLEDLSEKVGHLLFFVLNVVALPEEA